MADYTLFRPQVGKVTYIARIDSLITQLETDITTIQNGDFTSNITISKTLPQLNIFETDAAFDEKGWRATSISGTLYMHTVFDNGGGGPTWMQVDRNGTTVDKITLTATLIQVEDRLQIGSSASTSAILDLIDGDAPLNESWYGIGSVGSQFQVRVYSDAGSFVETPVVIDRTGTVADKITLDATEISILSNVLTLTGSQPQSILNETDAALNEKIYKVTNSGGVLLYQTRTDVDGVGANYMQITRAGTVVSKIDLEATKIECATGEFIVSHSAPFVRIEETDAPADEKIWNINSTAGTLAISTATDLNATINDAILMSRTGTTVDDITLTATELTIAARPTISSVTPEIRVTETDAPTLNQNWSLNFSSGSLVARLYDDSFSASTDFFSVTRSGLTASSITLDAAEINLNSTSGEVVIQSTAPKLRLFDDDEAGTDQKNWMIRSLSSSLAITTYTDGIAPVSNAMLFERTGTVVDKITLTATEVDIVGNLLVNGVAQPTITQGTWTPELWDASSSNAEGQAYGTRNGAWYQKHGEVVTIWGQLQMTALGTLTTSDVAVIGGIPFTSSATLDNGGGVSMTLATGLAITSGTTVSGRIQGSSANRIVLYVWDGTFGPSNMLISEITSDGALYFWGQYTTDA